MTDDNPSMGIKTKACVNGVYPDTIPTINQNISDIQDDIGNIEDELENNVVHTTGNETVAGNKTFSDTIYANDVIAKGLTVHGNEQSRLGTVVLTPVSQGAMVQLKDSMNRSISIEQSHDSNNNCYLREYPDNYYPVDENENPVAPSNATIMTSGLVAVDPRIVHTTGNEEIGGQKTFTENLKTTGTNGTVTISDSGLITYSNQQGSAIAGLYNTTDNQSYMFAPDYYPVDSDENPEVPAPDVVMTSGMIAVDPRIVHTTGNESVTGIKQGDFRGYMLNSPIATTVGKWLRYCVFDSVIDKSGLIEIIGTKSNNGVFYGLGIIGGRTSRIINLINGVGAWVADKVVLIFNSSTTQYEIWIYIGNVNEVNAINVSMLRYKFPNVTYLNTEHDSLPTDGYLTPIYIVGSA